MHAVYDYLQRNYKTGPLHLIDGQPQEKPFEEYPKWVTKADGTRVIVKNMREEATIAGDLSLPERPVDPLAAEKERLNAESDKLNLALSEVEDLKAQMRAQLAELETARAALGAAPKEVRSDGKSQSGQTAANSVQPNVKK